MTVFNRGLSEGLLERFEDGPCAVMLRACVGAGLDVRLRNEAVNLYFRGRSMARILGRKRRPTKLEIHPKYLATDRIGRFAGRPSGSYLAFDVDAAFAEDYVTDLDAMIRLARAHVGEEENVELRLLEGNGAGAPVCCFDRQIQVPGTRRTLDVVGVTTVGEPVLVAIEVKRYPDNRIQEVPGQLHEYLEIFDPGREGLRADIARSYRKVCWQLRRLGLPAPEPARVTPGMPVAGLAVVSDYNPRSKLLPRAHALAERLDRPIYLWQPEPGKFAIPPPGRWQRMGPQGSRGRLDKAADRADP